MSRENALPSIEDLPPWLRYLAVAFVQRHLLWSDIKLVIETQLGGAKSGDFPGRSGWMYTKNEYATWVYSNEAGVRFEFQPTAFWETLDLIGQLELYGTSDSTELPWTAAMRNGRVWLPEFGLAKAAMNDLVTLGFLEKGEGSYWLSWAAQDFAERLEPTAEGWSSKILNLEDAKTNKTLESEWREWIDEVAHDPKRADLSMITNLLSDEQLCDTMHERMALGDVSVSTVFGAAHDRALPLDPAKVESYLDSLRGNYSRVVCGPAEYALKNGVLKDKALDLLTDFAQLATGESPDYVLEDLPAEALKMLGDSTLEIVGLADAAILLIEYAPERSQIAIRRALRFDPMGVVPLSLRLGALGQDWATQELVAAIPNAPPGLEFHLLAVLKGCGHEEEARVAEGSLGPDDPLLDMFPELLGQTNQLSKVVEETVHAAVVAPEILEWAERVRAKLPVDFSFESVNSRPHQPKH